MLAGIRKRLARKHLDIKDCEDDDKDDLHGTAAFVPPTNYIKISQGKIQLVHQQPATPTTPPTSVHYSTGLRAQSPIISAPYSAPLTPLLSNGVVMESSSSKEKQQDKLENRIIELEAAVLRLQEKVNNSQCGSPTFEKELRQQLENMSRVMKSKERKQLQTCRDHKALQTRFARQENLLHTLQQENKALLLRIRQYEHCLDDVMRKVVDAIVAEDNLREEVTLLKGRVRDLEAQNAALSASPAKGRDEGYCTMSSGQPQPSNGHLEDLPEEPEQWLLPAEPCSTEMEDWSMSQEELAVITLDEEREQQQHNHQQQQQQHRRQNKLSDHDWIWNSSDLLNSTMVETDSVADNISQLLQQKIIYSEDEEVACTEFTNDFYKLVNIRSSSARSLYSYIEGDTDDEDDDDEEEDDDDDDTEDDDDDEVDDGNASLSPSHKRLRSKVLKSRQKPLSPTPSEAGRAQVTSCSSSETDDFSNCTTHPETTLQTLKENETICNEMMVNGVETPLDHHSDIEIEDVQLDGELLQTPIQIMNHTNHQRHLSENMTEKECIEQIIKTELSRTPRHKLMKSQSTIEERETCNILRTRQQQTEKPMQVVRSGSVNGNLVNKSRYQERLQNANNSWRRSNGWKRVISPSPSPSSSPSPTVNNSPKKESPKSIELKSPPKSTPTRIPSCIPTSIAPNNQQQKLNTTSNTAAHLQQQQQQQQQATRKSKIPPPVPVRRSYAS